MLAMIKKVEKNQLSLLKIKQSQWIQCIQIAFDRYRYHLSFCVKLCCRILVRSKVINDDYVDLFQSFSSSLSTSASYRAVINDIKRTIHDDTTKDDLLELLQEWRDLVSNVIDNADIASSYKQDVDEASSNIYWLIMNPLDATLCKVRKVIKSINESIIILVGIEEDENMQRLC